MALDAGVNLVDTADVYSGGAAEKTDPPRAGHRGRTWSL
jgi:hypothetical protein